jgi:FkbM family methyltransferase
VNGKRRITVAVDTLYFKQLLIRTPLEGVAKEIRNAFQGLKVLRHPGLREVYLEEGRIDRALRRIIKPTSNCIDVGAHIGSSLSYIVRLAPEGKHIAFEPLPTKAAWLRRKFPEVDVKQMAVSDISGKVTFSENLSRPGFSGLRTTVGSGDRTHDLIVDCDRLDRVVPQDSRTDFLKVDTEGAELLVLRGAGELLKRDRPVILFESGPGGAERFGLTRKALFSFLVDEQGYSVYLVKDFLSGGKPIDFAAFDQAHVYPFQAFNYLAVAQTHR